MTLASVQADFDTFKGDVATYVADVKAAFARLQASIDANTLDPQALADLDAAINSSDLDVKAADADANAEDSADTTTPPADGTDTGNSPTA